MRALPARLAAVGVVGGSCYDALVAVTAMGHGLVLHTLDRRAERTYRLLGAPYELLG